VFLFFAAFGMLFLGGCSNEEKLLSYENPSSGDGKLTFVLPMEYNGAVTYAAGDSTAGLAAEYEFKNLFIYWFTLDGSDYKWSKTFEYDSSGSGDITFAGGTVPSNSNARVGTATIDIGTTQTASRFYILANVNVTDGVMANGLKQLSPSTTSDAFELIASDALSPDANNKLKPLGTPIPMSIDKASASGNVTLGYYEINNPQMAGVVSGLQMKRRVARFDIMNNKDYSGLEITNIVVTRARSKGWLQDKDVDNSTDFISAKGDMYIPATSANGTRGSMDDKLDWYFDDSDPDVQNHHWASRNGQDKIPDDFQGSAPARDSLELNKSVFYLWPTWLKATVDGSGNPVDVTADTEILIEGKYKNVTKLYRLILKNDTELKANNRYTIRIARVTENTVGFELTVNHWIEGLNDSIVTTPPVETVIWGSLVKEDGSVVQDLATQNVSGVDATFEYSSDQVVKLILQTEGGTIGNKGVVKVEMTVDGQAGDDYLASDWNDTADPDNIRAETKVTYGTHYITSDTIYLPPTDAPLEYTMTISNVAKTTDRRVIKMKSINFGKKGKAVQYGTILDPSINTLKSLGAGRWQKAVVMNVAANGMPLNVLAYFGDDKPNYITISSVTADANAMLNQFATKATNTGVQDFAAANAGKALGVWQPATMVNGFTKLGFGGDALNQAFGVFAVQRTTTANSFTYYTGQGGGTTNTVNSSDSWWWDANRNIVCCLTY
jgi:hypothetical protein